MSFEKHLKKSIAGSFSYVKEFCQNKYKCVIMCEKNRT